LWQSTLLKMVAGLLQASSGEIALDGKRVEGPPDNIGIVFQSPVLLAWRTVLDNVLLQIDMRRIAAKPIHRQGTRAADMTGLGEFARKLPWNCRGGMRARIDLPGVGARPSVLLRDEPFGAPRCDAREKMNLSCSGFGTRRARRCCHHAQHPGGVFLADRVLVMTERPGRSPRSTMFALRGALAVDDGDPRCRAHADDPAALLRRRARSMASTIAIVVMRNDVRFRSPRSTFSSVRSACVCRSLGRATLREAPQAFVRARIRLPDGRSASGWAAEMMMPKWFDKSPQRSNAQNLDDLRRSLAVAAQAYASERRANGVRSCRFALPFDFAAGAG